MKTLLDTHALLWLITDDRRLSPKAKEAFLYVEKMQVLSRDRQFTDYGIVRVW